jgi:hypothetical protein
MFDRGQRVVCVDAGPSITPPIIGHWCPLRTGAVYTVSRCAVRRGELRVWLYEVRAPRGWRGFRPERFRPLPKATDISIFEKMLKIKTPVGADREAP